MTVEVATARVSYTGAGTTGPFTIPFYFLANADIRAIKVTIADSTEVELALTTDFTLTGAGVEAGGELTLVASLSSAYKLVIFRDPEVLQETRYPRNDPFPSESHEEVADRLTMITLRSRDLIERSVRLPDGDTSGESMVLPGVTSRQSKFLAFDADGAITVVDGSDGTTGSLAVALAASGGAALVGFLPSGIATTSHRSSRTVQAKVAEFCISVKDALNADGTTVAGDGVQDDTTGIQRAIDAVGANGGGVVFFPHGTYKLTAEITVPYDDVILDWADAAFTTSLDVGWIRFGAAADSATIYSGCGFRGRARATGSGTGKSNNTGITIRNVSYGYFLASVYMTNFGGFPFWHSAYGRGNQHNKIGGGWYIEDNPGGTWDINAGSQSGGYINDNSYDTIRGYNKTLGGSTTQGRIRGLLVNNNTFHQCSLEAASGTNVLLDNDTGTANVFKGLRLDGAGSATAYDGAAAAKGNIFTGLVTQGTVVDASNTSMLIRDEGSDDLPLFRIGSLSDSGSSWDIGIKKPSTTHELHVKANTAGGIVRFPNGTLVFVGDRDGGDAGPIELHATDKRIKLRTLPSVAIGSGPRLAFDGEFSSGGDEGSVEMYQDANGVRVEFSTASDMLHSSQAISVGDGITAPAAVAGRAIIYVDSADGDLKVKFADGTTKVLAADT